MKVSRLPVLALAGLLAFESAGACSIDSDPVEKIAADSTAAVIAFPETVTYSPARAADPNYDGIFLQTVVWRVQTIYKGELAAGDTITTSQTLDRFTCGDWSVKGHSSRLVYFFGKTQPYRLREVDLASAAADIRFLESRAKKHLKPTTTLRH
jgi:hypothetical protein